MTRKRTKEEGGANARREDRGAPCSVVVTI